MSRPQQRAPKGRDLDRLDRRNVVENLLARVHRTRLTSPEAALLGDYVREEQRAADATRSSLAGTTRALERNREAADDAIREAEQRAEQAEELQRIAHQTSNEAEQHRAAAEQRRAAQLDRHEDRRRALAEALEAPTGTPWPQLVTLASSRHHDAQANGEDCRAEYERARRLEAELAAAREQRTAAEQRTRAAEQALERVRRADTLGAAAAAVAEHDGLTPQAAAVHAAFTNAADSARARLEEQAREHAIELAGARRVIHAAERALTTVRHARTWGEAWAALGMYYGLRPEECGQQAKARRTAAERAADDRAAGWRRHALEADERADRHLAAWRSARARARSTEAELERIRAWCAHWADRTRTAEPRLARLALAWRSARRRAQERTRDAYANGAEYRALRDEIEKRAAEQIAYAGPHIPF
ncbi:hypothetical protein [[Kitasatospora] papulosa]|uniref:Uncharacterized protein n=1 Tax=[Kitasatospora] papulosa TaxID=1464011 RepID=A0ABZ1K6H7_9ACTN